MYTNAQMNEYMKQRWKRRRLEAVRFLGGKCVNCGETDADTLDFDHIDPKTKLYTIAKASGFSEKRFWSEIKKCQLLCIICHKKKTRIDLGQQDARIVHGTLSSYRYCKPSCDSCRLAARDYQRSRKLAKQV